MILETDFYWSVNIAPTVWRNTKMIKQRNNNMLKRNFTATLNAHNSRIFSFFICGGRKLHNQRRENLNRKLQVAYLVPRDRSEVESREVLVHQYTCWNFLGQNVYKLSLIWRPVNLQSCVWRAVQSHRQLVISVWGRHFLAEAFAYALISIAHARYLEGSLYLLEHFDRC